MGRYITLSASESEQLIGTTVELVDGEQTVGDYVKADGSLYDTTSYPQLANFVASQVSTDYMASGSSITSSHLCASDAEYIYNIVMIDGAVGFTRKNTLGSFIFPIAIQGTTGATAFSIRVFDTYTFVCTSVGLFAIDKTTLAVKLVFSRSVRDISFSGSLYFIVTNSTTAYTSTDALTWTAKTVSDDFVTTVYAQGKFVAKSSSTKVSHSSDLTSWGSLTANYGNNTYLLHVVNNVVVLQGTDNVLFQYTSNLSSFDYSTVDYSSYDIGFAYVGTTYYIFTAQSNQHRLYYGATLATTAYYTVGQTASAPAVSCGACAIGSNLFLHVYGKYEYIGVPSAAIGFNALRGVISGESVLIGQGYCVLAINDTQAALNYFQLFAEEDGMFVLKKFNASNHHFVSQASKLAFAHYAKHTGYFYYTTTALNANPAIKSFALTRDSASFPSSVDLSIGTISSYKLVLHSAGFYILMTTNGTSRFVYKALSFNGGLSAIGLSTSGSFVSSSGAEIFVSNNVSPFTIYRSGDYGANFTAATLTRYNAAGATVALVANTTLYRLGNMYYTSDGYSGESFAALYLSGAPVGVSGHFVEYSKKMLISSADTTTTTACFLVGGVPLVSSKLTYVVVTAYHLAKDGTFYGNGSRVAKASSSSPNYFLVPYIVPSKPSNAVYIKGK